MEDEKLVRFDNRWFWPRCGGVCRMEPLDSNELDVTVAAVRSSSPQPEGSNLMLSFIIINLLLLLLFLRCLVVVVVAAGVGSTSGGGARERRCSDKLLVLLAGSPRLLLLLSWCDLRRLVLLPELAPRSDLLNESGLARSWKLDRRRDRDDLGLSDTNSSSPVGNKSKASREARRSFFFLTDVLLRLLPPFTSSSRPFFGDEDDFFFFFLVGLVMTGSSGSASSRASLLL